MKRLLVLSLILIFILSGCGKVDTDNISSAVETGISDREISSGVWLSYLEVNTLLKSENGFKYECDKVAEKLYEFGINELYFHVRSH